MQRKKINTLRICVLGLMIAIYFLLAKLTIPIGNLRITLAPLPIVVLAMMLGPWDAALAALLGEFMIQALGSYGLTPTTPLWCLPPVFRALIVGAGYMWLKKRNNMQKQTATVLFFVFLILGALATTLANTAVTWADSVIFGYYSYAYVFGQLVIRLITGVITAVVVGVIAIPVTRALKHAAPGISK